MSHDDDSSQFLIVKIKSKKDFKGPYKEIFYHVPFLSIFQPCDLVDEFCESIWCMIKGLIWRITESYPNDIAKKFSSIDLAAL